MASYMDFPSGFPVLPSPPSLDEHLLEEAALEGLGGGDLGGNGLDAAVERAEEPGDLPLLLGVGDFEPKLQEAALGKVESCASLSQR